MLKHIIWAAVVLILGAFAVILLGTPEQAKMVVGVLSGTGVLIGVLAFFYLVVY